MTKLKISGLLAILLTIIMVAFALGDGPQLAPGNDDGLFVVEDASAQFQALKHHGEALAWILPEVSGAPDPSLFDHYQGVVRYPGQGKPVFYVTQKDNDDPTVPGAEGPGGYLHVFSFGSRETDGERLRSNVQVAGIDSLHTYPPDEDIWQRAIRFDGTLMIDGQALPAYVHPGGLAVVDDILFMALDSPISGSSPTGQIVLFDLSSNREQPIAIHAFPLDHSIDNLAVTAQQDGTYLIWINGDSGNVTRFYQTTSTDLRHELIDLELLQIWDHDSSEDFDGNGEGWPGAWVGPNAYQSSTFLREPDGSLYMIAMFHQLFGDFGFDYADLLKVEAKPEGGFKLTNIYRKHFYCEYRMAGAPSPENNNVDGTNCNFAAANNAYVSPSGELILYSMPHDDEDNYDPDFVRLAEFRHRDVNRETSPLRLPAAEANGPYAVLEGSTVTLSGSSLPLSDRPWVELYDDAGWDDRSIVIDYDDRALFELNDFDNLDSFGDKTSSIRWRLPVGLDVELFDDHDFSDRYIILKGTGQTEYIADLDSQVVVPGVVEHPGRNAGDALGFGDKTSSMRFVGAPVNQPLNITWDLDGDGLFGETGTAALNGDEVGASVTFSAVGLDGPGQVAVTLRVTEGIVSSESSTTITVLNVAPTAVFANVSGELIEGESALLSFSQQYDPSTADQNAGFAYDYDCDGDGIDELVDSTISNYTCDYPAAGTYTARGTIEDKDGDATAYTVTVVVLSPSEAINQLILLVQSLNLQQGINNSLDAKLDAALNALDDINNNNPNAATNTLQAFINNVEAQRDNQLTSQQADQLIQYTQRIIDSISSS